MIAKDRKILILVILFVSVVVDQVTKYIATQTIKFSPSMEYLGGFFVLKYAENTGAMLGFGSDLPEWARFWFLTIFVGLMLIALLAYLWINREFTRAQTTGLSLIAGGGISNFADRAINNGRVVDFMHMDTGIGWLKTGIFNFADVAIMAGLFVMIIWGEWHHKKQEEATENNIAPATKPEEKLPVNDANSEDGNLKK